MKCRSAASTWRILLSMLPLTSRASAIAQGPPLAAEERDRLTLPVVRHLEVLALCSPSTGWPALSRTETGTRTVRVPAAKVGRAGAHHRRRGPLGSSVAPSGAGAAGFETGAARRTATTRVSLAPAWRRARPRGPRPAPPRTRAPAAR